MWVMRPCSVQSAQGVGSAYLSIHQLRQTDVHKLLGLAEEFLKLLWQQSALSNKSQMFRNQIPNWKSQLVTSNSILV